MGNFGALHTGSIVGALIAVAPSVALKWHRQVIAAQEELTAIAVLRRQQAAEVEALTTVSAALSSSLDPAAVFQIILEQAERVLPFDHAQIALYRDGWVVSAATRGGPGIPSGTPLVRIDPTTSTWQTITTGKPAYLADTAEVPDWTDLPPWQGPYRVRSRIMVPLLIDGELIGSFKVNSSTPHFYTERLRSSRRRLSANGPPTQCATPGCMPPSRSARARPRNWRNCAEQAEESQALAQVSATLARIMEPRAELYSAILEQSTRVLPCDSANVFLYQQGMVTLAASWGEVQFAPGTVLFALDHAAGWLPAASAIPIICTGYRLRAGVATFPTVRGRVPHAKYHLGTAYSRRRACRSFDVASRTPNIYTERQIRLAGAFGERVTQALRNSRLLHRACCAQAGQNWPKPTSNAQTQRARIWPTRRRSKAGRARWICGQRNRGP